MKHAKSVPLVLLAFGLGTFGACGGGGAGPDAFGPSTVSGDDGGARPDARRLGVHHPFRDSGGGVYAGCVNLECQQIKCQGGAKTTLTGQVLDPSGRLPLYNAIVYVPNADPKPFADTIACDQCGAVTGNPLVTALTAPD